MSKTILYARVSRDDLHCENQKMILMSFIEREKVHANREYLQEEFRLSGRGSVMLLLLQELIGGQEVCKN